MSSRKCTWAEGVVTSFQIEDGKTVTLRRSGKVNAEMVFDRLAGT